MADYSESQLNSMQEEAIRRMRAMHRQGQQVVDHANAEFRGSGRGPAPHPAPPASVPRMGNAAAPRSRSRGSGGTMPALSSLGGMLGGSLQGVESLFSRLGLDNDRLMLMLLAFLLLEEGGNTPLLLALAYIFL